MEDTKVRAMTRAVGLAPTGLDRVSASGRIQAGGCKKGLPRVVGAEKPQILGVPQLLSCAFGLEGE